MDEYSQGTNAVVCVISYTGYDMEDAMIINKAAFERGFGYGSMYKTYTIDLEEEERKGANKDTGRPLYRFGNVKKPPLPSKRVSADSQRRSVGGGEEEEGYEEMEKEDEDVMNAESENQGGDMAGEKYVDDLDWDGIPEEGAKVHMGSPLACFIDSISGEHRVIKHKETEMAYVDTVRVFGALNGATGAAPGIRKVSVTLRFPRRPIIGDKFSSRHGQKGMYSPVLPCSYAYLLLLLSLSLLL